MSSRHWNPPLPRRILGGSRRGPLPVGPGEQIAEFRGLRVLAAAAGAWIGA